MPDRSYPRMSAPSSLEFEVPLTDVLSELRIVQHECRQPRTQVESVAPTEVTGSTRDGLREIASRQDALTARVELIDNHLNVIAQGQNDASTQALWDTLEQCVDQARRLQDRFRDISSEESDRR